MKTFENLYSRKSIRNFNGTPVTEEQLKEILKCAYSAPVGRAMYDTLQLSVITNKELLSQWENTAANISGQPDWHPFYGAPTVILISSTAPSGQLGNVNYSNAAIIAHNMTLGATELGVGACLIWGAVAFLNGGDLAKKLGVTDGFVPCCAVALGGFDGGYELREIPENRIKTEYIK